MIHADLIKNRIVLTGDTYRHKDVIKYFVGAKWDRKLKAWTFPPTIDALDALRAYFQDSLMIDAECLELDKQRERIAVAVSCKTNDDLTDPLMTKTAMWNHQKQAFHFAEAIMGEDGGGTLLAMDMGTGKTKVAIDLLNEHLASKILVICPKAVMQVWPAEFVKHSLHPYRIRTMTGNKTLPVKTQQVIDSEEEWDVLVVNKDIVWREPLRTFLLNAGFDFVIYDESHHIKSPGSKVSRFMHTLSRRSKFRLALTGTPMPQSPLDLYGQMRFVNENVYGASFVRFRSRYAIMGGFENRQVIGYHNEAELRRLFEENAFVVKSDDVLDLPEQMIVQRTCTLTPKERRVYRQMKDEFVAEVEDGVVTAANAMVKVIRLAQIANGVCDGERIGYSKQELLGEVIDELPDEPVVVFCRFWPDMDAVRDICKKGGRKYSELSGRRNDLAVWTQGVLAVQYQAGSAGVDLTLARYCLFYSPVYSLGDYQQAKKRVHRPGQSRAVTYVQLIAEATVDRQIYRILDDKKEVLENIFEAINEV